MTHIDALKTFRKQYPNLTVTEMLDYSRTYFLITAVKDVTKNDYNDPYYAVNKKTGQIMHYHPMSDLENFIDAKQNRVIEFNYLSGR